LATDVFVSRVGSSHDLIDHLGVGETSLIHYTIIIVQCCGSYSIIYIQFPILLIPILIYYSFYSKEGRPIHKPFRSGARYLESNDSYF